jgi:hypothetical protein
VKKIQMKQVAILSLAATLLFNPINASAALLKKGSKGNEVQSVQLALKDLGYFRYNNATGYYGTITYKAVKEFQKKNGLLADGIVGKQTRNAILKLTAKKQNAAVKLSTKTAEKATDQVSAQVTKSGALDWFKEVRYLWKRGVNATITDVNTGKSFQVRRTFGTNHADVEPLTKADSAMIKDIWGGWSWERRAVVVQVGDSILAGSMTAMPHAGVDSEPAVKIVNNRSDNYGRGQNLDAVKENGASGVMDLHFTNSRTHSTNVVQASHQNMVKKAAKYIESTLTKVIEVASNTK